MIVLTRLNHHSITINSDLIKYAESQPDTTLTLITGDKLVVLETIEEVQERCLEYRAKSLRQAWPGASIPLTAQVARDAFDIDARLHEEQ